MTGGLVMNSDGVMRPGVAWGKSAEKAVHWFRQAEQIGWIHSPLLGLWHGICRMTIDRGTDETMTGR